MTGIPPAPRGTPQIEVEFSIDANGILNVSATDKATGKSQNIEITGSSGLSEEEIDRMKREAEANAAEDKSKRELVEVRNRAEQFAYSTRQSLEEHGEKVSPEARAEIESALSNLEEKLKGDDKAAIEAAQSSLEQAATELGKAVYESTSAGTGPESDVEAGPEAGDPASDKDDVIDAEFEVKDN